MSEHHEPSVPARADLDDLIAHPAASVPASGTDSDAPTVVAHVPQQGLQVRRTSLVALADRLPEPALLIRSGRIEHVNPPLTRLLDHPRPELLAGLPADALLEGPVSRQGRTHLATLRARPEPVPVLLCIMDVALRDDEGSLWLLSPASDTTRALVDAADALQDLCASLWHEGALPAEALAALEAEEPAAPAAPAAPSDRLVDLLRDASERFDLPLSIRTDALHAAGVPGATAGRALTAALAQAAADARMDLRLDLAGHPTLVVRSESGPVIPPAAATRLRRHLARAHASVVLLDDDRTARVRLPRLHHDRPQG